MATQKIPGRAIKLGTDNAPDTTGDIAYFDGSVWKRLPIGVPGQRLTMNEAGTLPEWGYCFGGDSYGYCHGGTIPYAIAGNLSTYTDIIEKFAFATDSNATDVGNLNEGRGYMGGFHSTTHGYAISGQRGDWWDPNNWNGTRNIHKYAYASDGNATFVGDTVSPVGDDDRMCRGLVNAANTMGYAVAFEIATTTIQKISTVTDGNAVASTGTLHTAVSAASSACSASHGYIAGGGVSGGTNVIQKFSFVTDANGTDVGDLTETRRHNDAGASSCTHGYTMGWGGGGAPDSDKIEKWSFASDANSTVVGTLTVPKGWGSGQSSKTHGYHSGGGYSNPGPNNVPQALPAQSDIIEKFPFASDANATDSGDLTMPRFGLSGSEY
jgi:hypothetical protein